MRGGSRKFHTKSRKGCSQCKKARKKCDEKTPKCGACVRKRILCEYEETGWVNSLDQVGPSRKAFSPKTSEASRASNILKDFIHRFHISTAIPLSPVAEPLFKNPGQELELMQHYSNATVFSFSSLCPPEFSEAFSKMVPQEAHSHEFLMRLVLATSSAHLAHLRSWESAKYAYMAYSYHQSALQSFRESVTEVTPQNATAILTFSFMLTIFTLGSSFIPNLPTTSNAIDTFSTLISTLRGFWQLQPAVCNSIQDEHILRWLHLGSPQRAHSANPSMPLVLAELTKVIELNEVALYNEAEKEVYRITLKALQQHFIQVLQPPIFWSHALAWPLSLSDAFIELLSAKRPMALIILAHWTVSIHHATDVWFLRHWGKMMTSDVAQLLDLGWLSAIDWPLKEIGINCQNSMVDPAWDSLLAMPRVTSSVDPALDMTGTVGTGAGVGVVTHSLSPTTVSPEIDHLPFLCRNPEVESLMAFSEAVSSPGEMDYDTQESVADTSSIISAKREQS